MFCPSVQFVITPEQIFTFTLTTIITLSYAVTFCVLVSWYEFRNFSFLKCSTFYNFASIKAVAILGPIRKVRHNFSPSLLVCVLLHSYLLFSVYVLALISFSLFATFPFFLSRYLNLCSSLFTSLTFLACMYYLKQWSI